jgi:hypothetical protein
MTCMPRHGGLDTWRVGEVKQVLGQREFTVCVTLFAATNHDIYWAVGCMREL